ncbi:hypothetical protein NliqN6_5437 [Naganishia liquefaciens]|uniref:Peptidase M20 dimerisation domain-containing protein n=1 Tax=Naganishia liquefaciens TaxID=104408 RepID=A0A8H3YGN0_9TREE|nr:hypothetical protein NliqN6_5437 [Naganishia liquefaciens]
MQSSSASKEPAAIPSPVTDARTRKQPIPAWRKWTAAALLAFVVVPFLHDSLSPDTSLAGVLGRDELESAKCPVQPKALMPKISFEWDEAYKAHSAKLLSRAVGLRDEKQIPTVSYDDMGKPQEDIRWNPFVEFKQWLVATFPLVHEKAHVEYVNTLGIVLTLKGSDESLKPLVLMSHYDVVPAPANTADRWDHPAFSGYYDGEYVWGRGAADDKTLLVAQYEALTKLLENESYQPRRTVILAHGFDEEEVGARQGAGQIAPFLEERYGKDGVLLVVDEGTGTVDGLWGAGFALPANAEKGYLDVKVVVGTPGGHSSVPPAHTGIGIMSQIVKSIEDHPFEPTLSKASPHLGLLACGAEHAPAFPKAYKKMLASPKKWSKLAASWAGESVAQRALLSTTQAIDIISGGVKVNALPERVEMMMNFRIDFASSIKETQDHLSHAIALVAKTNNMTFMPFPTKEEENNADLGDRYVVSQVFGIPLEPAPYTPEEGGVFDMFAGTIKAVLPGPDGEERIVAPYSSTGNTDTKMYWNLTRNIFRFMSAPMGGGMSGAHTVNEKAGIDAHLQIVKFVHALVQAANDYEGQE